MGGFWKNTQMIIYDLIQRASTDDIISLIKFYYGSKHTDEIREYLIKLKTLNYKQVLRF